MKFLARTPGQTLFLTEREAVIAPNCGPGRSCGHVKMTFAGTLPSAITGEQRQRGVSHYLLANQNYTGVPQFGRVRYRGVFPGIDVAYYGNERQLEYDFLVQPGADPRAIRLRFEGHRELSIDESGDLVLGVEHGEIRQHRPFVYQQDGNDKQKVAGSYVRLSENEVGFSVGPYDRRRPLVIDPVMSYGTYLGGSGDDTATSVAVDAQGSVYVAGNTGLSGFPSSGAVEAPNRRSYALFITKLNPAGSEIVYSTIINFGITSFDHARGLAVDGAGNAVLAGYSDACALDYGPFVLKLNSSGSALAYRRCLRGARGDAAHAVAVDAAGNAYLAGRGSIDSPAGFRNACLNRCAFVAKFDPAGEFIWGMHLANETGSTSSASAVAVDPEGNVFLAGEGSIPATANAFQRAAAGGGDAFVAKLNSSGAVVYASYLGGAGVDAAAAIAIDNSGNAYVAGETASTNFPTTAAFQPRAGGGSDAFVAKVNAAGSALVFSTLLGGSGADAARGLAADSSGVYVVGRTASSAFPVRDPLQPASGGGTCANQPCADAFVSKLSASGELIYSTLLGGSGGDSANSVAADASGIYVAGTTGSSNFPTARAMQGTFGGGNNAATGAAGDVFVVKIAAGGTLTGGATEARAVVNAASYAAGAPSAAGAIVSVFGTGLATTLSLATGTPLPSSLGGSTALFNGSIPAPIFFTSPTQMNVQVPWELAGRQQATLSVRVGDLITTVNVPLAQAAPGLFSASASGTGQGAVLIANTASLAAPSSAYAGARPVRRGEFIQIYGTGLGPVNNAPASGTMAPASPLSETLSPPQVTVGGIAAPVSFSGLAPGFVGLYQVNAQVPGSAPAGDAVPVAISVGGVAANLVTIAVE